MRIGIDGNLLCGKKTGMGTVVYHVLINYINHHNIDTVILYVFEPLDEDFIRKMKNNNITIKLLPKKNYIAWEQITIPNQIRKDNIDVFWFPYNTGSVYVKCKSVVTINDVIYMKNKLLNPPTIYKKLGQLYRKLIVPIVAKNSNAIVTISNYAKNEIIEVFPNVEEKMRVSYLSVENSAKKLSEKEWVNFSHKNGLNNNYILGFGSLEKRKNSLLLIKAYERVIRQNNNKFQLVLFGFRGWEKSEEYEYIIKNDLMDIKLLGYVSEREKNSLYAHSKIFVFPSLAEGFGLPVLEAFANETPVITSNTTSLPEIVEDAGLLVDPSSCEAIEKAISKILNDPLLSSQLIKKGKFQLAKFDWSTTASDIFNILKTVK